MAAEEIPHECGYVTSALHPPAENCLSVFLKAAPHRTRRSALEDSDFPEQTLRWLLNIAAAVPFFGSAFPVCFASPCFPGRRDSALQPDVHLFFCLNRYLYLQLHLYLHLYLYLYLYLYFYLLHYRYFYIAALPGFLSAPYYTVWPVSVLLSGPHYADCPVSRLLSGPHYADCLVSCLLSAPHCALCPAPVFLSGPCYSYTLCPVPGFLSGPYHTDCPVSRLLSAPHCALCPVSGQMPDPCCTVQTVSDRPSVPCHTVWPVPATAAIPAAETAAAILPGRNSSRFPCHFPSGGKTLSADGTHAAPACLLLSRLSNAAAVSVYGPFLPIPKTAYRLPRYTDLPPSGPAVLLSVQAAQSPESVRHPAAVFPSASRPLLFPS